VRHMTNIYVWGSGTTTIGPSYRIDTQLAPQSPNWVNQDSTKISYSLILAHSQGTGAIQCAPSP
jgi:hypothetical protein